MDSYQDEQLKLVRKIEESFKSGESPSTIVEPVSDYTQDNRICLTAVFFTPHEIEQKIISEIVIPLKEVDPFQYYYVPGSYHMTIQNIRVINDPPHFDEKTIEKARQVFSKVIGRHKTFNVVVKRLFDLPTSLSISAFTDPELGELTRDLRNELEEAKIADDKKYVPGVTLGNITISRFTNTPNEDFMQKVKELKDIEVGGFKVDKVVLLTTNSVSYPSKTKIIEEYQLA